eukprot:TRINITY_DN779903_c0_g1_i1.p1 TRINITY_DN779903_c0_g1~~TRINITY_DN779903_c0_g1_i1.p1  ORF type:complete len:275 (+),score=54.67 TRINITY_DN779903_c0_g1_i1:78-902(+)
MSSEQQQSNKDINLDPMPTISEPKDEIQVKEGMSPGLKVALFFFIVLVLFVIGFMIPKSTLQEIVEFPRDLGVAGRVLMAAMYAGATVIMVPGTLFTLAAGFLFGIWQGIIVAFTGATAGAILAFLVGRSFLKQWLSKKLEKHHKFAAIQQSVGEKGFKVVLLIRLSLLFPFNLTNYLFSATNVKLSAYSLATGLGILPVLSMLVVIGAGLDNIDEITDSISSKPAYVVALISGIVMAIVVTVYIVRVAQQSLKDFEASHEETVQTSPKISGIV